MLFWEVMENVGGEAYLEEANHSDEPLKVILGARSLPVFLCILSTMR
jgi:hypothetical protein